MAGLNTQPIRERFNILHGQRPISTVPEIN